MMDEAKEREAFERWWAVHPKDFGVGALTAAFKELQRESWLARAALAQPEPEPEQWKVVDEWAGGCRLRRVQPEPEPELPALPDMWKNHPYFTLAEMQHYTRAAILADRKRREHP